MMKPFSSAIFLLAVFWLFASAPCAGGAAAKIHPGKQWTLNDTVRRALNHSPAVKREEEEIKMRSQNLRQAKAGYLPKLDVQASGGAGTLPVSRNE